MSHITAGETIVDYVTHTGWDGAPITTATFTVVTARKPNGSAFTPTITHLGNGVYKIEIATARTEDGPWYLLLSDTALTPDKYYDSLWDVDPPSSESSAGVSGGVTRATLRRGIGRLMGDVIVATTTADGTTTTALDTVNLNYENAGLTGRMLYVYAATNTANEGLIRRVTGNTKATGTVTFTPALPAVTKAGDVVELFAKRGVGPGPLEIHEAINRAIQAARDNHVSPALSAESTLDYLNPNVTIPSTWTFFAGAEWKDYEDIWRPVPRADLELDKVSRTVRFANRARWLADQRSVRLRGYLPPAALDSDDDGTSVDAEWIMNQSAADLWMASSDQQNDPAGAERKAQYFQGKADGLRAKTRVRPNGMFVRLP
jgi:hypothetical protein